MAASPYEHTLIETRIHIKQNRKTHKTDAKKRCLCTIQSSLHQETSDTSDNSYANNTIVMLITNRGGVLKDVLGLEDVLEDTF